MVVILGVYEATSTIGWTWYVPTFMEIMTDFQVYVFFGMVGSGVLLILSKPLGFGRAAARWVWKLAIAYMVFLTFAMFSIQADTFELASRKGGLRAESWTLFAAARDTLRTLSYLVWAGYVIWIARRFVNRREDGRREGKSDAAPGDLKNAETGLRGGESSTSLVEERTA